MKSCITTDEADFVSTLPACLLPRFYGFIPVSTEKAFVTGVEAANAVVEYLGAGRPIEIIPLEQDEPHIQALRQVNGRAKNLVSTLPGAGWLLP